MAGHLANKSANGHLIFNNSNGHLVQEGGTCCTSCSCAGTVLPNITVTVAGVTYCCLTDDPLGGERTFNANGSYLLDTWGGCGSTATSRQGDGQIDSLFYDVTCGVGPPTTYIMDIHILIKWLGPTDRRWLIVGYAHMLEGAPDEGWSVWFVGHHACNICDGAYIVANELTACSDVASYDPICSNVPASFIGTPIESGYGGTLTFESTCP